VSPIKQAKGDSGMEPKLYQVIEMEKKLWKPGSARGPVFLPRVDKWTCPSC